eukprot:7743729-Alexandrium_andersonii.AAC.1
MRAEAAEKKAKQLWERAVSLQCNRGAKLEAALRRARGTLESARLRNWAGTEAARRQRAFEDLGGREARNRLRRRECAPRGRGRSVMGGEDVS